jgi:hypothetical protein
MDMLIVVLAPFALGFGAGYGVREWKSRMRRSGFTAITRSEVCIASAAPTSRSSSSGNEIALMDSTSAANKNPIPQRVNETFAEDRRDRLSRGVQARL